jgi:hypothetical protein
MGGMRFVVADGRASLVRGDAVFDVAECSDGAIPADPMLVLRDHWVRGGESQGLGPCPPNARCITSTAIATSMPFSWGGRCGQPR